MSRFRNRAWDEVAAGAHRMRHRVNAQKSITLSIYSPGLLGADDGLWLSVIEMRAIGRFSSLELARAAAEEELDAHLAEAALRGGPG